ncbi:hypothetical protein ATANTOWER_029106 [Ataeniobius toweri]|uniref:Uncharacterized protein n=1 Tax=Ataeniobius toweri TaxID=208326 RepID=A0ABU7BFD2_9TELE|nr:hypothetical protein [Ataeniobius toweri]
MMGDSVFLDRQNSYLHRRSPSLPRDLSFYGDGPRRLRGEKESSGEKVLPRSDPAFAEPDVLPAAGVCLRTIAKYVLPGG